RDSFANTNKQATSHSSFTPIVNRVGTTDSHTNKHKPLKWLMEERKSEVAYALESRFKVHNDVLNMVVPKCSLKRAEAERVASLVAAQLESVVVGTTSHSLPNDDSNSSKSRGRARGRARARGKSTNTSSGSINEMRFLKLTCNQSPAKDNQSTAKFRNESEMYPVIASLLQYIEGSIGKFASTHDSTHTGPSQSVKVFGKADTSPKDSDNYLRIDLGLFVKDMWKRPEFEDSRVKNNNGADSGITDPRYADIFAVVEAKISKRDQIQAYNQLLLYTYNIYWRQHDRRFAWGLTVCDTIVRACVFGNDGFLSSEDMDLAKADGRSEFVKLLVNMTYCGREQLGFDPTIRYNDTSSSWEIDVFNDSDGGKTTCEIVSVMQAAERVFGRHTRCFECKLADDDQSRGHFIVKDAWAYAECDSDSQDLRDEVSVLRDINEQLGADASLDGKIPTLYWGGVVKMAGQDGITTDDVADPLFKILEGGDSAKHRRVHKRLAMGPIGEPLRMAKSVDELIIVVADAMEAHNAILERCGILHRDISTNNILINRSKGHVRGMLIDYDCAIRTNTNDKTVSRPEMTGTLPFMSTNNLDIALNNDANYIPTPRSGLDDWESLIYVLSWLGTFGINITDEAQRIADLKAQKQEQKDRFSAGLKGGTSLGQTKQKMLKPYNKLLIRKWREGDTDDILWCKRTHLESHEKFDMFIVQDFYKDEYSSLQTLVHELRNNLFDNAKCLPECKGTFILATIDPPTNPFKARIDYASDIMKDLLAVVRAQRDKAIERINNSK
ncbi:hypothetical protein GGF39_003828, partial [Coemansia sp. RSA 1721]